MADLSPVSCELISMLKKHPPRDEEEAANIERTIQWLQISPDPLNRHIFTPGHGTGSAFITDLPHEHVLLVMHGKLNRWLQPGGHADAGETDPLLVACREAREEVGCHLPGETGRFFDMDVHTVPARRGDPRHLHFDFRYLFETAPGPIVAASDALEARWFTLEEAMQLALDPGLRRMIGKLH
jgi:8-oxo-dGTP pyrophosphatase MutT (NUDIX family)